MNIGTLLVGDPTRMETLDGLSKPEAASSCENDSAGHERLFKFPSVGVRLFSYLCCVHTSSSNFLRVV